MSNENNQLCISPPPKSKMGLPLITNIKVARVYLSRIIRLFENDVIDDKKAKALTYMVNTYIVANRENEIEEKLDKLEKILNEVRCY